MKSKVILCLFYFFSLAFTQGCSKTEKQKIEIKIRERLEYLYKADPLIDVENAIELQDYRFMGYYGYVSIVPISTACLEKEFGVKMIKGTSDALENYEHGKLQALAIVYAEYYNHIMYVYIIENGLSKCTE
jgi:hypothetical protein